MIQTARLECARRLAALVCVLALATAGCTAMKHGASLSRYQGQVLRADRGGGEERLELEMGYDATIRNWVGQHGWPDYLLVESAKTVLLIYVDEDRVVRFQRGWTTISEASIEAGIPDRIAHFYTKEDRERQAAGRELRADAPRTRSRIASGAAAATPPTRKTERASAGTPPSERRLAARTPRSSQTGAIAGAQPSGSARAAEAERTSKPPTRERSQRSRQAASPPASPSKPQRQARPASRKPRPDPKAGAITVEHDEFTGETTVKLQRMVLDNDLKLSMFATPGAQAAAILLFSSSEDWRYLRCRSLYWLADGKRIRTMQPRHEGDVGSGLVFESLTLAIDQPTLSTFANSSSLKGKICNTTFQFSGSQLVKMREFLQRAKLRP